MVDTGGIEDFDHIRRLAFKVGTESGFKVAAVIAGKGFLQIGLPVAAGTLETGRQNGGSGTDIVTRLKHGFVVQTVGSQVIAVYLHQPHAEIPPLRVQHFGCGHRLGHAARLAGQRSIYYPDGIGVELAFHTGNGLQGIGMNLFAALLRQLGNKTRCEVAAGRVLAVASAGMAASAVIKTIFLNIIEIPLLITWYFFPILTSTL